MPFNGYDLITRITDVHKAASALTEKAPSRARSSSSRPRAASASPRSRSTSASPRPGSGSDRARRRQHPVRRPARRCCGRPGTRRRCSTCRPTASPRSDLADVLWRGPADIDVLLAPPRIEMAEMVLIRDVEKTLSLMRRLYDLVIVDTRRRARRAHLALLDQADTILEIVTYDATTIRNTIAMAETFQKIGYPPSKVQYLVNRGDAPAGIDPKELARGAWPRAGVQDPVARPGRRSGQQPGRPVRARPTPTPASAATSSRSRRSCSATRSPVRAASRPWPAPGRRPRHRRSCCPGDRLTTHRGLRFRRRRADRPARDPPPAARRIDHLLRRQRARAVRHAAGRGGPSLLDAVHRCARRARRQGHRRRLQHLDRDRAG